MNSVESPKVQARFFGLSYIEINELIQKINPIVGKLGSQSEEGKTLTELQGVLQDLGKYAESMRVCEPQIEAAIARAQANRPKTHKKRPNTRPRKKQNKK